MDHPRSLRRIAIAGLGAAARQIHLPAYAELDRVSVVGGFDPAVSSGLFSFPLYDSLEEMLTAARPDILVVAAPPAEHLALTRSGLRAGCHVLCEKPLAPELDQVTEIVELSRESERWVVVNNQYRFMNIHRAAKGGHRHAAVRRAVVRRRSADLQCDEGGLAWH